MVQINKGGGFLQVKTPKKHRLNYFLFKFGHTVDIGSGPLRLHAAIRFYYMFQWDIQDFQTNLKKNFAYEVSYKILQNKAARVYFTMTKKFT